MARSPHSPLTVAVPESVRPAAADLDALLLIRHFEEALLRLFQAGRLSGTTHTCLGQEHVPVAIMPLLRDDDFVFSNHRGHGHYLARFGDPEGLLAEIMGREGGVCHGVGGSQHIRRGRYYSTGVQGESLPVAVGAALQLAREGRGALAMPFIGDGTWGQGAVYEALNMAALWQVPLAVVVENNGIAQSTPTTLAMAGTIEGRVRGFGIDYARFTGQDVPALRAAIAPLLERVRRDRTPLVIELVTHRLGSHSKGDDTRDPEQLAALRAADWYARLAAADPDGFAAADLRARHRIETLVQKLEAAPPSTWNVPEGRRPSDAPPPATASMPRAGERVLDHLNRALHGAFAADERVLMLGEDLLDPYGGAFKVARGLSTAFPDRVLTTPISELGITGVANGLALAGRRPILEFMFGDFIYLAFDQIVNFAAKSVSMYGERVPHHLLVRCPVGGHRGYGATHSQSVQKHLLGVPDLELFELSPLHDTARLLPWLLERGNPCVLFESKTLYAQEQHGEGPLDDLFGVDFVDDGLTARVAIDPAGAQAVLLATGGMAPAAIAAARRLFLEHEIEAHVLVPFQLYPLRVAPIAAALPAGAPLFVVEESGAGGTWGAEVLAALAREAPERAGAVQLVHSADAIIPSARHLESALLVQPDTIVRRVVEVLHAADRRPDHQHERH